MVDVVSTPVVSRTLVDCGKSAKNVNAVLSQLERCFPGSNRGKV